MDNNAGASPFIKKDIEPKQPKQGYWAGVKENFIGLYTDFFLLIPEIWAWIIEFLPKLFWIFVIWDIFEAFVKDYGLAEYANMVLIDLVKGAAAAVLLGSFLSLLIVLLFLIGLLSVFSVKKS